jgi:hypothetical protein
MGQHYRPPSKKVLERLDWFHDAALKQAAELGLHVGQGRYEHDNEYLDGLDREIESLSERVAELKAQLNAAKRVSEAFDATLAGAPEVLKKPTRRAILAAEKRRTGQLSEPVLETAD